MSAPFMAAMAYWRKECWSATLLKGDAILTGPPVKMYSVQGEIFNDAKFDYLFWLW